MKEMDISLNSIDLIKYDESKDGWSAWFKLGLYDGDSKQKIPEDFYTLVASSQRVIESLNDSNERIHEMSLVLPDRLDILAVGRYIKDRFSKVRPRDWEDFYAQMEQYFVYDD